MSRLLCGLIYFGTWVITAQASTVPHFCLAALRAREQLQDKGVLIAGLDAQKAFQSFLNKIDDPDFAVFDSDGMDLYLPNFASYSPGLDPADLAILKSRLRNLLSDVQSSHVNFSRSGAGALFKVSGEAELAIFYEHIYRIMNEYSRVVGPILLRHQELQHSREQWIMSYLSFMSVFVSKANQSEASDSYIFGMSAIAAIYYFYLTEKNRPNLPFAEAAKDFPKIENYLGLLMRRSPDFDWATLHLNFQVSRKFLFFADSREFPLSNLMDELRLGYSKEEKGDVLLKFDFVLEQNSNSPSLLIGIRTEDLNEQLETGRRLNVDDEVGVRAFQFQ